MTLIYRPDIDGLRGISIALVLLYHAGIANFEGGFLGVDVFFVISGWLITQIVLAEMKSGSFSFAGFYERRARRLLPSLFIVLGASSIAAWHILTPEALAEFGRHAVASSLFFMNMQFWSERGYFATGLEVSPLFHLWSLSVEEQFYLFYPVALVFLIKRRTAAVSRVLIVTTILSFMGAVMLSASPVTRDATFFLLPFRAWELLAGAVTALHADRIGGFAAQRPKVAELAAAAGLCLIASGVALVDDKSWHPGFVTLLPVTGSVLLIMFAPGTRLGKLLCWRVLVGLGLISYAAYLVHQPLFAFARIYLARDLSSPETYAALLASLFIAWMLYTFAETPARRKKLVSRKVVFGVSAAGLAVIAALGTTITSSRGFPLRMQESQLQVDAAIKSGLAARNEGIRLGHCHYNADFVPDLDRFLDNWQCLPVGDGPVVLAIGDSISADRAWMLWSAGFRVGNIGGAHCGLLPTDTPSDPCTRILNRARALVMANQVDGIVLSNRWRVPPSRADLSRLADYWQSDKVRMLVFSPMPVFPDYRRRIAKQIREAVPLSAIVDDPQAYADRLRAFEALTDRGIPVVNTRSLLCGATQDPCSGFMENTPLLSDEVHAQPAATEIMAGKVAQDPVWNSWYQSLK